MSVVTAVGRSAFGTVRSDRKLLSNRSPIILRLKLTVARPCVYAARNEPECRGRRKQRLARLELLARALVRHDLGIDERVRAHGREPGERTL